MYLTADKLCDDAQQHEEERAHQEAELGVKRHHPRALASHVWRARKIGQGDAEDQYRQKSAAVEVIAYRINAEHDAEVQDVGVRHSGQLRPAVVDQTAPTMKPTSSDTMMWCEKSLAKPPSREPSAPDFSKLPTRSTAMTSPSDDSIVSVIFTGSGVLICCSAGMTMVPLVHPKRCAQQQAIHPLQVQQPVTHDGDQREAEAEAQDDQQQSRRKVAHRLTQAQFQPPSKRMRISASVPRMLITPSKCCGLIQCRIGPSVIPISSSTMMSGTRVSLESRFAATARTSSAAGRPKM